MACSNNNFSEGIYKKLSFSTASHPKPDHSPDSASSHKKKRATFFSRNMLSNQNEQPRTNSSHPKHFANDGKAGSRQEHVQQVVNHDGEKPSVRASASKTKSALRDGGKFSDYIKKVKDRMRSVSSVGAVRSATRRDSFNDKVSHYINTAKIKIRNVGTDSDASFRDRN